MTGSTGKDPRTPKQRESDERFAERKMPLFLMRKGVPLRFIGVTRTQEKDRLVVELWPLASEREVREFRERIGSSEMWRVVRE